MCGFVCILMNVVILKSSTGERRKSQDEDVEQYVYRVCVCGACVNRERM